jgi:hypothetical protein
MIELEHSPLGGSAAHRFMTCEGSFLLQREQILAGQFEQIESEWAKLGTGAHELAAACLKQEREPYEFLGEEFNGYLAGWPDGINLDAVTIYVNECQRISRDVCNYSGFCCYIEDTIHLPEIHPLLKGTIDFGVAHKKHGIFLRDYKNGEGIGVAAPMNKQLLYYGFLMILKILQDGHGLDPKMPVSLGIVQPNFYGIFEEPDVWETDVQFVLDWGNNELLPKMRSLSELRVPKEFMVFTPGEHCQFCPVLLDCPKMQEAFEAYYNAEEDFIAMLTDEELDRFYSMREPARRFMKALETTVHHRLVTGAKIPNAKLVEKKVARVWRPGAAAALKAAFGEKAFTTPEVKSPAQIEKLSSRGKELALEWGYKPESAGLSVAPLTDPRPEAKPKGNADVFASFAQSPEEAGF